MSIYSVIEGVQSLGLPSTFFIDVDKGDHKRIFPHSYYILKDVISDSTLVTLYFSS